MKNSCSTSGVLVWRTFYRALRVFAIATTIGLVAGIANNSAAADSDGGTRVQSWAVGHIAPLPAVTAQYNNQTLREIVHTSVGGDQVRVRIANTFGTAPLVIGAAHVAVSTSGASIVAGTDRALTFGGRAAVITTAAGWSKISVSAEQTPSPTPPIHERMPVCSARARTSSGRTAAAGSVV